MSVPGDDAEEHLYTNCDGDDVPYDDLSEAEQAYYDYMDSADDDDPGTHVSIHVYTRNWERGGSGISINDEGEPEVD